MKNRWKFLVALSLVALVLSGTACSRLFGPSNADAIKAINDSGLLTNQGFTLMAPVEIIEKGSRDKDGSWPFKVKLTLNLKLINGTTKQIVTTPTFKIFKTKDSSGNTVWSARLGGG